MNTLVFDVNETLLDLAHLDPLFEDVFGSSQVRKEWFSQVILDATVVTLTDTYADFATIGVSAFKLVAARREVEVSEEDFGRVVAGMRSLPPHPEVDVQLKRLYDKGFKLVTLTNSPPAMVAAQLDNAGISKYFQQQISVDAVKAFKPAAKVYDHAASELSEDPNQLWLIAAHNWDTSGAIAAGWNAAFIARPGCRISSLDAQPQIVGSSLVEVVDELIKLKES
ncbi:MAG: haloacid dehalogenase type II [Chloroflexi bacterium]|nr:haloacid dehalogenase type II [Chloroflexota bacterium]